MSRTAKVTVGLLVLGGLGFIWSTGALDGLSDPENIRSLVHSYGAAGPLVFILIAMALMPVFMFGPPVWASTLLWSWPVALLYAFIAAVLSSLLTYLLARRSSGGQPAIPDNLKRYTQGLLTRPITTVIIIRFLLWANPVADVMIAISGVSLRPYMIGTMVGLLPPTVVHVFLGTGLQHIDAVPSGVWVLAAALVFVTGLYATLRRHA